MGDCIVLRVRDDGVFFNPTTDTAKDSDADIGIRLLKGFSPSLTYTRLLDFNNTIIKIPYPAAQAECVCAHEL